MQMENLFFQSNPQKRKTKRGKINKGTEKVNSGAQVKHDHRRKILGETSNHHNLVFCNYKGNIMVPSELTRAFKRSLKAANLPDSRFHD
ncbi:hypothetical protein [Neobacillus novalis]|nr:hypothetical protein [Neobacillus novalis]